MLKKNIHIVYIRKTETLIKFIVRSVNQEITRVKEYEFRNEVNLK